VIVDYHMHLRDPQERVDYTVEGVERFVERARERGIDEIGMTEHVYYFAQTREIWNRPYDVQRCVQDLDTYVDAVLEAKRKGLPVKLGLEVDYAGELQGRLSEILAPYPWDYLLGSVHWVGSDAVDQRPGVWEKLTVEEVWRAYFESIAELAASGAVDVLAHPDLPKIFGRRPETPSDFYPALAGVAIEISTAGLRKPVGELYPDPALLAHAKALGLPITLASDAHVPKLVGEDFDQALELAAGAGYETVTVFEGRVGRQEPLG
jgi:histidinol-phosphatase (PHP family)